MAYRPSPLKIIGNVIRTLLYSLIAAMVLFLVWRIWFSTKMPETIKKLNINQPLKEAYAAADGQLYAFDQPQEEFTRGDDNYGYFSIEDYVIIPDAHQVQIVFRYNNSTVEKLVEDFESVTQVPDRKQKLYEVTLLKTTDLTPDDPDDNTSELSRSETRYEPTEIITEYTLLYSFHRIIFDNVDINEEDIALFADIYYVGEVNYEELPYGSICLYDDQMRSRDYEFDKADLKRLANSVK